jgi:hypothetical protein
MLGITCRAGGLGLGRIGVDVLEELETTVAVRCLEHGDGHAFLAIDPEGEPLESTGFRFRCGRTKEHRAEPHSRRHDAGPTATNDVRR